MTPEPAPVIQLGEPMTRRQLQAELDDRLPNLEERMRQFGGDPDELSGHVFATRRLAQKFVAAHPEVDGPVQIDCMCADVLTTSYVSELLAAWPGATFFNCNGDAAASVTSVRERL